MDPLELRASRSRRAHGGAGGAISPRRRWPRGKGPRAFGLAGVTVAALGLAIAVASAALAGAGMVARGENAGDGDDPPHSAAVHTVEIRGFAFLPESLAVVPGDTVVWRNLDLVPHTATLTEPGWDSGELVPGASWRLVVNEGGAYLCTLHPSMRGMLTVLASNDPGNGAR